METITFTAVDNVGTPISTPIDLTGNVVYPTDFYDEALNQSSVNTADGGVIVYGTSLDIVYAKLIMKGIEYSEGNVFRQWVKEWLNFKANYVLIDFNGHQVNLGRGPGINIVVDNKAKYMYSDTRRLAKLSAPGVHTITFDIRYRRILP